MVGWLVGSLELILGNLAWAPSRFAHTPGGEPVCAKPERYLKMGRVELVEKPRNAMLKRNGEKPSQTTGR